MSKGRESGDEPAGDGYVDFLDCETARVTGEFADLVLDVVWWEGPAADRVGTIREPVGGVDGERTVSVTEEFGEFAYGPILVALEAFEEGTPVVPGLGDLEVENPRAEACQEAILESFEDGREPTT